MLRLLVWDYVFGNVHRAEGNGNQIKPAGGEQRGPDESEAVSVHYYDTFCGRGKEKA